MSSEFIDRVLDSGIDWYRSEAYSPYVLWAKFDHKIVLLRFNDFPDEPLCTLIIDGLERDIDEFPRTWTLPSKRATGPGAVEEG